MVAGALHRDRVVVREVSAGGGDVKARADCSRASACGAKTACALTSFTQGAWPPGVRRAGFWLVKPASLPRWRQSVLARSPP